MIRVLIAARDSQRARDVAVARGYGAGQYRMLTYETHRAFPDTPMYVDMTWPSHRNASAIEAIIAVRIRNAMDTPKQAYDRTYRQRKLSVHPQGE